jgi:hypothetical protein
VPPQYLYKQNKKAEEEQKWVTYTYSENYTREITELLKSKYKNPFETTNTV